MFPALTTRTAYEVFYTRLGQYTLSVANYWYDPQHRDLYLKYSLYLAVVDNVKFQNTSATTNSTIITENDTDIKENVEARVSAAITAVAVAAIKVAEGHNDNNVESVTSVSTIDDILADVSFNDADCISMEDNITNANTRKLGLTRLQHFIMIGGPDDGVISPWQSR